MEFIASAYGPHVKTYWKKVACQSFAASRELVLGTNKALIISVLIAGVILLSFWIYGTHDNQVDQIKSVARGLFGTIAVFLLVWAWEFIRAPFLMSEEQKKQIGTLEQQLAGIPANIKLTFEPASGIAWTENRRAGIGASVDHVQWIKVRAENTGEENATGCTAFLVEAQHREGNEYRKIGEINSRPLNWSNHGIAPITLYPSVGQYIDVVRIVSGRLELQGEQVEKYVDDRLNAHSDMRLLLQVMGDGVRSDVFQFDVAWDSQNNSLVVQGQNISRDRQ